VLFCHFSKKKRLLASSCGSVFWCDFQLWNELAEELKKPYYLEAERIKNQHRQDFPGKCLHRVFSPLPASYTSDLVFCYRFTTVATFFTNPSQSHHRLSLSSGPDLREGKLGSCPGPPQLGGLHKNSKKNYYLRKHENAF